MAKGSKTGGRKRGTPNKATVTKQMRLDEALSQSGVDVGTSLAEAIQSKDVDMIKAIASVLPFLTPRIIPAEASEDTPDPQEDDLPDDEAKLLELVKS